MRELDIYITEKYINGTFNSCKKVSVPSTGNLALDLMCGEYGAADCSGQRWFKFMGTPDENEENGYVPFRINYKAQNSTDPVNTDSGKYIPKDPKMVPCYEKLNVSDKLTNLKTPISSRF